MADPAWKEREDQELMPEKDLEKGGQRVLTDSQWNALVVIDASIQTRLLFIRKVYTILSAQLMISLAFIIASTINASFKHFIQSNVALLWACVGLSLVLVLILACIPPSILKYPWDLITLFAFTVLMSYLLAAITSVYDTTSVLQAVIITAIITIGLTLYTFQSKSDFQWMGGILFVCLMVLIVGGFLRLFFPFTPFIATVWACFGALVFSCFIVYDTSLILHKFTPDMYVVAALTLYLDIINLFIYILQIFGRRD